MIYLFIENLARKILEWALRKQNVDRHLLDEVEELYSRKPPRRFK